MKETYKSRVYTGRPAYAAWRAVKALDDVTHWMPIPETPRMYELPKIKK